MVIQDTNFTKLLKSVSFDDFYRIIFILMTNNFLYFV